MVRMPWLGRSSKSHMNLSQDRYPTLSDRLRAFEPNSLFSEFPLLRSTFPEARSDRQEVACIVRLLRLALEGERRTEAMR